MLFHLLSDRLVEFQKIPGRIIEKALPADAGHFPEV